MSALDAGDGGLERAVLERLWQFGRGDGSVIAAHVRLVRGGYVTGHRQRNESAWRVHQGALEFLNPEGEVTCRFDTVEVDERGTMALSGAFRRKADVTHVLRQVRSLRGAGPPNIGPRVALLVRTHLVNDKLFDLLDILNQSRRYDLFVAADETRESLDVRGYEKLAHTAASCGDFGLCTRHSRILWHCGDYPLYFAAAEIPDYDYYAMIEYDVDLARKSPLFLEGLFARLHNGDSGGLDLVAPGVGRAFKEWWWAKTASRAFETVYTTGLFAFLVVSKRAISHLLQWRRKEALSGVAGNDIVHCEAFCASALIEANFACTSLNALVESAIDYKSFHPSSPELPNTEFLLDHYRLDNPRVELVHPVYDLAAYLERQYQKSLRANSMDAFLADLPQVDPARRKDVELLARYREIALASAGAA